MKSPTSRRYEMSIKVGIISGNTKELAGLLRNIAILIEKVADQRVSIDLDIQFLAKDC